VSGALSTLLTPMEHLQRLLSLGKSFSNIDGLTIPLVYLRRRAHRERRHAEHLHHPSCGTSFNLKA
jgi:hypothetical protein